MGPIVVEDVKVVSDEEDEEDVGYPETSPSTFGSMWMVGSRLMIKTSEFADTIHDYILMLESDKSDSDSATKQEDNSDEWWLTVYTLYIQSICT
jgi:hypothetical protein